MMKFRPRQLALNNQILKRNCQTRNFRSSIFDFRFLSSKGLCHCGLIVSLLFAASELVAANMTPIFIDGSSLVTNYNAPDWFNNTGFALQGVERINVNSGAVSGAPSNPRFYQTSIDLAGALGATNKTLASITFDQPSAGRSTGIYAGSGEVAPQSPATIVANPTNATVNELSSVTFSALASGNPFPGLQWYKSGALLSAATGLSCNIPVA